MGRNYRYEYEYDVRYCYPGSNVLKNKLNITDMDILEEAERHIERTIGFHVLDHEVKFYGICRECMKKGK